MEFHSSMELTMIINAAPSVIQTCARGFARHLCILLENMSERGFVPIRA